MLRDLAATISRYRCAGLLSRIPWSLAAWSQPQCSWVGAPMDMTECHGLRYAKEMHADCCWGAQRLNLARSRSALPEC